MIDPLLKITNCGGCNGKVIVARCPKGIIGNIDVENLTLHITGKTIGNIFGTGIANYTRIKQMKRKKSFSYGKI